MQIKYSGGLNTLPYYGTLYTVIWAKRGCSRQVIVSVVVDSISVYLEGKIRPWTFAQSTDDDMA